MNQTESTFLQITVPAAQSAQRSYGVPASVILAQATIESAWGQSVLARQANNFFGIKADDKADPGKYVEFVAPDAARAKYVRYASPALCFCAHAHLLSMAIRYRNAMATKDDPISFAFALQACGYSTDPNYGNKLMQIVQQFDLTQYDVASSTASPQQVAVEGRAGSASHGFIPEPLPASSSEAVPPAAPAKVKP